MAFDSNCCGDRDDSNSDRNPMQFRLCCFKRLPPRRISRLGISLQAHTRFSSEDMRMLINIWAFLETSRRYFMTDLP